MANISSPGIYINEIDQSFLAESIIQVGAAIVGATAKGPVEIPTVVTSYAEYTARFGELLDSGSDSYSFYNNSAAYNYFTNGGDALLVTRVANGAYSSATVNVPNGATGGSSTVKVLNKHQDALLDSLDGGGNTQTADLTGVTITGFVTESGETTDPTVTFTMTTNGSGVITGLTVTSFDTYDYGAGDDIVFFAADNANLIADMTASLADSVTSPTAIASTGSLEDIIQYDTVTGTTAFTLNTFAEGTDQNSADGTIGGTKNNIKYQIKNANTESGTFTLEIRRGDDTEDNKVTLEQFFNCTLDPYDDNYIGKLVGTQYGVVQTPSGEDPYVQIEGEYPNNSKYVYITNINPTPNFSDLDGNVSDANYKFKVPTNTALAGIGFDNGTGSPLAGAKFGKDITTTNIQGVAASDYTASFQILKDPKYQYTALAAPGINDKDHSAQVNELLEAAKSRQNFLAITDLVGYDGTITEAVAEAAGINNSYAAAYYPWLLATEPGTGKAVWSPASTFIPGVFAFNDKIGEPWFAPAGLNRGALPTVLNTARSLTKANRDTLYDGKINPITAFPGAGIVVFGQKTLQSKASALDRINVRRLLITIKQFLDSQAGNIVFEANTVATRNNFLAIVNPYLESVQQRQGLYAFKVIMDESINTPAVIDRNQLVGQFYLQPTKTAEFIILNFNVQPTGASFPD